MTWPKRLYRAALIFGLLPLAIGLGVFLCWYAADWDWLPSAGMATVFWGSIATLLGLVCLIGYGVTALRTTPKRHIAGRFVIALPLLLANPAVALLILSTVAQIPVPRVRVFVANDGPDLAGFVLSGACAKVDIGAIASGGWNQRKIVIKRRGKLQFDASQSGRPISGVIAEQITPDDEPDFELTFADDGTWSVEDLRAGQALR
jgi:hypothetical protein